MNKLEYYIVKFLQKCIRETYKNLPSSIKYITLEDELIAVVKGEGENELYVITECNLNNMSSDLITYKHVVDTTYKVSWSPVFLYLIGAINESEIDPALLTNELKLIQLSSQPLTNYLKSK